MMIINPYAFGGPPVNEFFEDDTVTKGAWMASDMGGAGYNFPLGTNREGIKSMPAWITGFSISGGVSFGGGGSYSSLYEIDNPLGGYTDYVVYNANGGQRTVSFTVDPGRQAIFSICIPNATSTRSINLKLKDGATNADLTAERSYVQNTGGVGTGAGIWSRWKVKGFVKVNIRHAGDNSYWAGMLFD